MHNVHWVVPVGPDGITQKLLIRFVPTAADAPVPGYQAQKGPQGIPDVGTRGSPAALLWATRWYCQGTVAERVRALPSGLPNALT
jgi:hypothetical protein